MSIETVLLEDAENALRRRIEKCLGSDPLERAFAAWLAPDAISSEAGSDLVRQIVTESNRTYRDAAALGLVGHVMQLDSSATGLLQTELSHLFGREPVVEGTPMPFCIDGLALAGIMLGTRLFEDDGLRAQAASWTAKCCKVTADGKGLDEWQEWLLRLLGEKLSLNWSGHRPWSATASVLSVALRTHGLAPTRSLEQGDDEENQVLALIQGQNQQEVALGEAVVRLAALRRIRRIRPVADLRSASVDDLVRLLARIPDALNRWTWEHKPRTKTSTEPRKWHVDNEYHVQNLIWLVLAPVFPDLIPEDYTPKVGPVQPRADVGIPGLRTAVEVKFMRAGDAPKRMIQEIAEDASLYLVAGSRYDKIVAFIWDDSRRSELHAELERGLCQIKGVLGAIIISRPGSMEETPEGETNAAVS